MLDVRLDYILFFFFFKKNIVHRDLRLGNIIYDLHAQKVYLINFCLGCHLIDEKELLTGQFGR